MKELRLGTRGSPLALKQANMVKDELIAKFPEMEVDIVVVKTSGDWKPSDGETRLSEEEGGKGLFAKEIEQQLLSGDIDIAVHSMKDMESFLPEGLTIPWMLPREDPRDAVICNNLFNNSQNMSDLPRACVVGTSSVRRAAFLLNKRPDVNIQPLRGNVQTRLDKLKNKQVEATLLAIAGLNRLGLDHEASFVLEVDDMLPAAAQGAVGIEIKVDDLDKLSFIGQISCSKTVSCISAEREVLRVLDGSCHTPIGAHAWLENGDMHLKAAVCSLDGQQYFEERQSVVFHDLSDAVTLGNTVGQNLKKHLPQGFLE